MARIPALIVLVSAGVAAFMRAPSPGFLSARPSGRAMAPRLLRAASSPGGSAAQGSGANERPKVNLPYTTRPLSEGLQAARRGGPTPAPTSRGPGEATRPRGTRQEPVEKPGGNTSKAEALAAGPGPAATTPAPPRAGSPPVRAALAVATPPEAPAVPPPAGDAGSNATPSAVGNSSDSGAGPVSRAAPEPPRVAPAPPAPAPAKAAPPAASKAAPPRAKAPPPPAKAAARPKDAPPRPRSPAPTQRRGPLPKQPVVGQQSPMFPSSPLDQLLSLPQQVLGFLPPEAPGILAGLAAFVIFAVVAANISGMGRQSEPAASIKPTVPTVVQVKSPFLAEAASAAAPPMATRVLEAVRAPAPPAAPVLAPTLQGLAAVHTAPVPTARVASAPAPSPGVAPVTPPAPAPEAFTIRVEMPDLSGLETLAQEASDFAASGWQVAAEVLPQAMKQGAMEMLTSTWKQFSESRMQPAPQGDGTAAGVGQPALAPDVSSPAVAQEDPEGDDHPPSQEPPETDLVEEGVVSEGLSEVAGATPEMPSHLVVAVEHGAAAPAEASLEPVLTTKLS